MGASIPIIDHSQPATESVGVGMYHSLMRTFNCLEPIFMMGSSFCAASSSLNSVCFRTTHMEDPWIFLSPSTSSVPIETDVLFPVTMVVYQENLDHVVEPSTSSS